jgi:alpha-mannosidase
MTKKWTSLIFICLFFVSLAEIQVFLVPHSHTDPGWLKTVEVKKNKLNEKEYKPTVFQILSNVVKALQTAENRRFIWGETIFFKVSPLEFL